MASACREAGVDIVLSSPVSEIIVEKGRAAGVVSGGKSWRAPTIAAGVNPKLLFDRLVPKGAVSRPVEEHFAHWGCESATFRMNVALDKLPSFTVKPGRGDHLTAGIIMAPSMDYMHRAFADAALNGWSSRPVIEMLIPSTLDPSLAPKGKHVASLFCQHFRFKLPDGRSWDDEREKAADAIIATVEGHAPGFAKSVIARQIHSPLDLERRFGLIGGDIFHGKMGLDQLFSSRPMIGAADYRMDFNAGATLNLKAPGTSATGIAATYQGILVYQDRRAQDGTNSNQQSRMNGNASSFLQGSLYFPKQQVTFNGTAGMSTQCFQLVARRVYYSGTMNISNSCPSDSGAHDFTGKKVRLVA